MIDQLTSSPTAEPGDGGTHLDAPLQPGRGAQGDRAPLLTDELPERDDADVRGSTDQVPASANDYRIAVDNDWIASDPEINTRLHAAGFTQGQAQLVYELAAERLSPMVAEVASLFDAERQTERLARHFGSETRWRETARQIAAWGRRTLDPPIFEALATTYEGVLAMHAMMQHSEPPLVRQGTGGGEPASEADVRQLMRDPRYWRDQDPDIVRQVRNGFRTLYPD